MSKILKNIFSIQNSKNKFHKNIKILGITFQINRRKKKDTINIVKQPSYSDIFQTYKSKQRFCTENLMFSEKKITIVDAPSFAYQVKEIFVDEIYKFQAKQISPIIYDCGSNIGISVLYFKKLFPNAKIYAFECDKKVFKVLQSNLLNLDSIHLYENAVWVNNDILKFNSQGADAGSLVNSFQDTYAVQAIRLKSLLAQEKEIDFLKIDIEGAETEVIQDCADELDKIRNIFIEYHSIKNSIQTLDQILSILTKKGFRYHLENISSYKNFYTSSSKHATMDLQINIFAKNINL